VFKKLLLASLVFLAAPFLKAADLEPLSIRDFSCGLVTAYDPTVIENGCSQQAWNVDVWTGRLQKRRGSLLQNSTPLTGNQPVRFTAEFPDQNGNKWLITASSNSLFKSNNSGGTNSVLTSTCGISATSQFSSVNAFGKIRLVDGSTNCIVFDGNVFTESTNTPRGTLIAFMFQRVFVANVSGTNSVLYMSRINDPEDYTDDGLADDDAASVFIRQNDGYPIRALVPYGNQLLIFKDRSIDALTMDNSGLVPIITAISNNIGTQHPKSVQVRTNDVIFMGPDGFYSLFGNSLTNISQGIKPTFDTILQKNSTSRSITLTTKADFDTGTSSGIATSVVQNSLVLSTWTAIDTSSTDFLAGTLINMTTSFLDGGIAVSTVLVNGGFEFGPGPVNIFGFTTVPGYSEVQAYVTTTTNPRSGTYCLTREPGSSGSVPAVFKSSTCFVVVRDTNSVVLQITTFTGLSTSYTQKTIDLSSFQNQMINISFAFPLDSFFGGGTQTAITTDYFYCNHSPATFYILMYLIGSYYNFRLDDFIGFGNASFTSQIFNTGLSSPTWLSSSVSTASNSSTFTWTTQSSNDGVTFDAAASWIPGTSPASNIKRYIRYIISIATSATPAIPYIQDVTLAARSSFGDYLSAGQSIGTNINSWGLFSSNNSTNGGSITYAIYTDTNSSIVRTNSATWISSQTITSGSIPTISTAPFLFFYTTMTITASTQAPQVDDLVINWNEGSANFPVTSLFFEGDYLAAVSTKSITANDTIFVYDRNNHWNPLYTGLNCYSLTLYNQQAYCGSSLAGNIYRIQVDNLYSDNGSAINSYWKSKEFDFGYTMTDKTMRKYFVTAKYNATSSVSFAYGVNRGATTSSSLNLGSVTGFFKQVVPVSNLTYQRGISHSFSFSNNTVDQYFDILAVELWPRLETPPGP
jgi:hypothetical protein